MPKNSKTASKNSKRPSKQQKGSKSQKQSANPSLTSILLVVFAVGLVLLSALMIYRLQGEKANATTTVPAAAKTITLTDSSRTFSFKYPRHWSLVPYVAPGQDGPAQETDWSKTPQPITLRSHHLDQAQITVTGYKNITTTVDQEIAAGVQDQFNTYQKTTVNGNPAVKHVLDFVGPDEAEAYKDTTYTILHGSDKVDVKFRERYSHSTTNHQDDFDATRLAPDFEQVVNSITFL